MKVLRKLNEVLSEILKTLGISYECIVVIKKLMQEVVNLYNYGVDIL